jgi:hypothetical protein
VKFGYETLMKIKEAIASNKISDAGLGQRKGKRMATENNEAGSPFLDR